MDFMTKPENKRDVVLFLSGARSWGKSTLMLRTLLKISKFRNEKLNLKRDIYYIDLLNSFLPGSESYGYVIQSYKRRLLGVDEGYFSGLNLDTNNPVVRGFAATINAVRNRQHVQIINFTALKRAAKILLENANIWEHKPGQDYAILYVKQNEFTGDDPWAVDQLIGSKSLSSIRYYLIHNPWYVTTMRTKAIHKDVYEIYDKLKDMAQEYKAQREQYMDSMNSINVSIVEELYKKFKAGEINLIDAQNYISVNYRFSIKLAKIYAKKLQEHVQMMNAHSALQGIS